MQLTGIDLNPYAARAAAESTPKELAVTWVTGDALAYRPEKPVDIVVSSLMAHHLEDEEVISLLQWMEATAQLGWFINDLERSEWSCRMFGWVGRIVEWHRFVRHDGPVSFRRAFREEDWVRLLAAAGVPRKAVTVEHWRPGRLCVGRWMEAAINDRKPATSFGVSCSRWSLISLARERSRSVFHPLEDLASSRLAI